MKNTKTITPRDLIYHVKPRTSPFGYKLISLVKGKGRRVDTQGVYRVGSAFGGRIAMY